MSINILQFIPAQPTYIPSAEMTMEAEQFIKGLLPEASEIQSSVSADIEFIDAGSNYKDATCPHCGQKIDQDWWSVAMDEAFKTNFSDLEVVPPCCGVTTSLNDLNYRWPQGFARFVLKVFDPGVLQVDSKVTEALEKILNCKVRVIWSHY